MKAIPRDSYLLLISHNPCDIFDYFNVDEMHGLNKVDCERHINNTEQSYIAGWCNLIPGSDRYFIFINLSRCNTDVETFGHLMHELMHRSFDLHEDEETIITWAEMEAHRVYELIKYLI
jgi:hypothetical protein